MTFCSEKPMSESSWAAAWSIPPGMPFRSSDTSANLRPFCWSTIARAHSRVFSPVTFASERTQPIMK